MDMQTKNLDEEQRALRQMLRDFVRAEIAPVVRDIRLRTEAPSPHSGPPKELVGKVGQLGLHVINIPEKYGGISYDLLTQVTIVEELARGGSGVMVQQNWKVCDMIADHAPQHLQDYWFPRIVADPTFVTANAMTEPRGASDRWLPYNGVDANLNTTAVLKDGHWVINGQKQFISNAPDAKLFTVHANTNPNVGVLDGTSCFLVPRDAPGMTIGPVAGDVYFDDCRIPEDHILIRDTSIRDYEHYADLAKPLILAMLLGRGESAYEVTAEFCKTRWQGGRYIIQHQLVGAGLAHMAIKLQSARASMYWAIRALEEGVSDAGLITQMAMHHGIEMVFDVCRRALELWGGMGTAPEAGMMNYLNAAAVGLHLDGTLDIQKLKIAKLLFPDMPLPYAGPVEEPLEAIAVAAD